MDPDLFDHAKALFIELCELPPEELHARLAEIEAENPALAAEVAALLDHDDSPLLEPLAPPPTPFPSVPGYQLLRVIGSGGMGVVYEAEQVSPRRRVAVKLIRTGTVGPSLRRRFDHEIQVLGRLSHPGIAQIFDAGMTTEDASGQPFYAMEYIDGRKITDFVTEGKLSISERIELLAKVADAVQHAHLSGVIHRDLKPENVLVLDREVGSNGTEIGDRILAQPKILDFGVARAVENESSLFIEQTVAGQLIGTVPFMSPEQASGGWDAIDIRSDVYALGVLAFEVLSGTLPHDLDGKSIPLMIRAIQEDEPRRLSSIDSRYRGDIDTILQKALERSPGDRYQSAADFAADLRRHLRSEPIVARPHSALYQLHRFAKRHRAVFAATVAIVTALLIATIVSVRAANDMGRAATLARQKGYVASIGSAAAASEMREPVSARERLDAAEPEFRGWEWAHLNSRLDGSELAIEFESPLLAVAIAPIAEGSTTNDESSPAFEWLTMTRAGVIEHFDARTGARLHSIELPPGDWIDAAFALEIGSVVTLRAIEEGDAVAVVEAFDLATGERTETLFTLDEEASVIHTAADASWISVGSIANTHVIQGPKVPIAARRSYRLGALVGSSDRRRLCMGVTDRKGDIGVLRSYESDGDYLGQYKLYGRILDIALSDDATVGAIASDRKVIHLIDLTTHQRLGHLRGHSAPVTALAFDRSGGLLSGGEDRRLIYWDTTSGKIRTVFSGSAGKVTDCGFFDDDQRVWASTEHSIRSWRVDDPLAGHIVAEPGSWTYTVRFSPDGKILLAAGQFSHLRFLDSETGESIGRSVRFSGGAERIVAFDGTVAWMSYKKTLYSFDLAHPTEIPRALIQAIPWSALGLDFVAARVITVQGSTAKIQDAHSGELLTTIEAPPAEGKFVGASIAPDGTYAVVASVDGRLTWLEPATGRTIAVERGAASSTCRALRFDRDGKWLARSLENGDVELWDPKRRRLLHTLSGHRSFVPALRFSPDGTRLASGSDDTQIRIWHVELGEPLLVLNGHSQYVQDLDFHPSGAWLVSASGDGTVRMWDTRPTREREAIGRAREARRAELRAAVRARLDRGEGIESVIAALDREATSEIDRALIEQCAILEAHERAKEK